MNEELDILVFDPDFEERETLVSLLKTLHPRVLEAGTRREALKAYRTYSPGIIFADVQLYGVDEEEEEELKKLVSADDPAVMEAILRGGQGDEIILDSIKSGASEFLEIPITIAQLRQVISRLTLLVDRKKYDAFRPGTLSQAEFDLTLASRGAAIAPTVKLIVSLLKAYIKSDQLAYFEMAVDEAIRNAYEHGSLGIGHEEKQELCEGNLLERRLMELESEAVKSEKSIRVRVKCSEDEFSCSIEDQGNGFDWRNAGNSHDPVEALTALHGRGLLLIRNVFDRVAFNEKGNKVTLIKRFDT